MGNSFPVNSIPLHVESSIVSPVTASGGGSNRNPFTEADGVGDGAHVLKAAT